MTIITYINGFGGTFKVKLNTTKKEEIRKWWEKALKANSNTLANFTLIQIDILFKSGKTFTRNKYTCKKYNKDFWEF